MYQATMFKQPSHLTENSAAQNILATTDALLANLNACMSIVQQAAMTPEDLSFVTKFIRNSRILPEELSSKDPSENAIYQIKRTQLKETVANLEEEIQAINNTNASVVHPVKMRRTFN